MVITVKIIDSGDLLSDNGFSVDCWTTFLHEGIWIRQRGRSHKVKAGIGKTKSYKIVEGSF